MPSFDIVSEVDKVEVRNSVDQATKEIGTRFDFKDTNSRVELSKDKVNDINRKTLYKQTKEKPARTTVIINIKEFFLKHTDYFSKVKRYVNLLDEFLLLNPSKN